MLRLSVECDRQVQRFPLPSKASVLGSSERSDLVCAFPGISKRHAEIGPTEHGVVLVDLGSKNGLVHEGVKLNQVELGVGERVRLGKAWLSLEDVSSGDARNAVSLERVEGRAPSPLGDTSTYSVLRANEALRLPQGVALGSSPAMRRLLEKVESARNSRLDVLLLGETGVGKEVFARILHESGPTAEHPFVAINCAAVPGDLAEAELFGIEEGAATGVRGRIGTFEMAGQGTLLLDEIGDLPLAVQAKLLRVLEEREVLAVGASQPRQIGARVIAATNRPLTELMAEGRFRKDLYYRLEGLELVIPPLRERRDEIEGLAVHFVRTEASNLSKHIAGISEKAMKVLCEYPWPGNVRELKKAVVGAVTHSPSGASLESSSFPKQVEWQATQRTARVADTPEEWSVSRRARPGEFVPLAERVSRTEREAVREALERTGNNKTQAAALLGISRQALNAKLRRWRSQCGDGDAPSVPGRRRREGG